MVVNHALSKLFHRLARALLSGHATELDFHHAAHRSVHDEVFVLRTHGAHAGLLAGCTSGAGIAVAPVLVLRTIRIATAAVAVAVLVGILILVGHPGFAGDCPNAARQNYGYKPNLY